MTEELLHKGEKAKAASYKLATLNADVKNRALEAIADALVKRSDEIIRANNDNSNYNYGKDYYCM